MKTNIIFWTCLFFLVFTSTLQSQQYSSTEIRQATGHGPYPVTFSIQRSWSGGRSLFSEFTRDFNHVFEADNKTTLRGFSGNLEMVFASDHFLTLFGNNGFKINGVKLALSYRNLNRSIQNKKNLRLHLQEETIGLYLGYRKNLLYPITGEILCGPTFYNFYAVTQHDDDKSEADSSFLQFRFGNGLFERDRDNYKVCSGLDLKFRLNLFDPAGTEGGFGIVIEYGRMITFGNRNLAPIYDDFLEQNKQSNKSWDYGYFSAGLIIPLALRVVSK